MHAPRSCAWFTRPVLDARAVRNTRTGDSGTLSALIARGHSPVASRASHAAKYRSRLNGTDESLPSTRRVSPCLSVQACHLKRLMQTFRLMYGLCRWESHVHYGGLCSPQVPTVNE